MSEVLMLMVIVFAAYLFVPATWFSKLLALETLETVSVQSPQTVALVRKDVASIPEDSVLRRHFIAQLRSEIELALAPRPTDFTLQRHYDAMVEAELENRLATASV